MPRGQKYPNWQKSMDAEAHIEGYRGFIHFLVWTGCGIALILLLMFWLLT